MAIDIKIDCKIGDDAEVISSLLPHLKGMAYQISVTAPIKEEVRRPGTLYVHAEKMRDFVRRKSDKVDGASSQPLGTNKRKVFSVFMNNPANFYTINELCSGTGLDKAQVRSVLVDAAKRTEIEKRTIGAIPQYKITSRGIGRLEQFMENMNTHGSHVGNAA